MHRGEMQGKIAYLLCAMLDERYRMGGYDRRAGYAAGYQAHVGIIRVSGPVLLGYRREVVPW